MGHPFRLLEGPSNCGEVFGQRSLDGLAGLKASNPDEYDAALWLKARRGRVVFAQAVGDGYQWDKSRISAITGVPTIIGWKGHEEQWRGGSDLTDPRRDDLETLYTSSDSAAVRQVIEKYGIDYVVLSPIEQEEYGNPGISEMDGLLERAFQEGNVTIYRVRTETLEASGANR